MKISGLKFSSRMRYERVFVYVIAISLLPVLFFLFFNPSNLQRGMQEWVGNLTPLGEIQQRHFGALHWEKVARESKIYRRDYLATSSDSRAIVTFRNQKPIELESDSLAQIGETPDANRRATLGLIDGRMRTESGLESKDKESVIHQPSPHRLLIFLPEVDAFQERYDSLRDRVTEHLLKKLNYESPISQEDEKKREGR